MGGALCQVVRRRAAQRLGQLRRPPRGGRPRGSRRLPLGGRARGRHPHRHLWRSARARVQGGQRAERARGDRRRPRGHLPADDPRGRRRDARLRTPRRAPLGRLWRVLGRGLGRPDPRPRRRARHHRRWRVPPRHRIGPQGQRRPGARAVSQRADRARHPTHRPGRGVERRTRRVVARHRRAPERVAHARGLRRRAAALCHVHERHDGQAKGHPAHDRRLSHPRGDHPPARVRPEARARRVLDCGRHRLGDRPQLHRLRPARQRDHLGHVRGDPRRRRSRPVVADRRGPQGLDPLHGADDHPDPHEVG